MVQSKTDLLGVSLDQLRSALATNPAEPSRWAERIYAALEPFAGAMHREVVSAGQIPVVIGEVNPDLQNAPSIERHAETTRDRMIELTERAHFLRAGIRQALTGGLQDVSRWRHEVQELVNALEQIREEENKFVLNSINADLGSGE